MDYYSIDELEAMPIGAQVYDEAGDWATKKQNGRWDFGEEYPYVRNVQSMGLDGWMIKPPSRPNAAVS